MDKKHKAKKGVIWSAIEKISAQGIQFVTSIILARLLLPSDFGLIAIILIVLTTLQTINEVGFGAALMYKQDRDDLDFSSVFILNICLGVFLYFMLYLIAPHMASFFNLPQLTFITRLIGISLIINSFIVVQRTKLLIKIDFKTQAKASLAAVILSGFVGVYMAFNGYGVMALVYQFLIKSLVNVLLIWNFVKWRPSLEFSYKRLIYLFKFAYKLIIARLINTLFEQGYSLVIGKIYGSTQLGYFNRGQSFITLTSNNITGIVQRVSTPLLCELQNDKKKMGELLNKFISTTALIVYPILFGLFVLAEPLIIVLLTDKWLPSARILQVLCPVGLFFVISTFNKNIFNATGRTDLALQSEIIKKAIYIVIILIAISFGFTILTSSLIAIAIIEFIIDTYYTRKQIGLTMLQQIKSVSGIIIASIITAITIYLATCYISSYLLKLIIGFCIGIFTYSAIIYVFNVGDFRSTFRSIYSA